MPEDILALIDGALTGYEISKDAMRWRPEDSDPLPEPERPTWPMPFTSFASLRPVTGEYYLDEETAAIVSRLAESIIATYSGPPAWSCYVPVNRPDGLITGLPEI
jgi:hypothetical protein